MGADGGEVPLVTNCKTYTTEADFKDLLESSLSIPDLLLLGVDPDISNSIYPDRTWKKYPRGRGEVVFQTREQRQPPRPEEAAGTPVDGCASEDVKRVMESCQVRDHFGNQ